LTLPPGRLTGKRSTGEKTRIKVDRSGSHREILGTSLGELLKKEKVAWEDKVQKGNGRRRKTELDRRQKLQTGIPDLQEGKETGRSLN